MHNDSRRAALLPACLLVFCGCGYSAEKYVATTGGADTPSNGTLLAPYATINYAVSQSAVGDNINLRGGNYRQQANITKALTVRSYAGETAIIDGADILTGWTIHDSPKGIWKLTTPITIPTSEVNLDPANGNFNPEGTGIQQVFDNGNAMKQVGIPRGQNDSSTIYHNVIHSGVWSYPWNGSAPTTPNVREIPSPEATNNLNAGTFWCQRVSGQWNQFNLYIRLSDSSNPSSHTILAGVRGHPVNITGAGATLSAVTVQHAMSLGRFSDLGWGMVHVDADNVTVNKCLIQYGDGGGVHLGYLRTGTKILDCTIQYNGIVGIQGSNSFGFEVKGCTVVYNNTRKFNPNWGAAGIKVATNSYGTIHYNECANNGGPGIWFDTGTTSVASVINSNFLHDNRPPSPYTAQEGDLSIERCTGLGGFLIMNNILYNSPTRGINISDSDRVKVYNNTIIGTTGRSDKVGAAIGVYNSSSLTSVFNNIVYNTNSGGVGSDLVYDLRLSNDGNTSSNWNTSDNNLFFRPVANYRFGNSDTDNSGTFDTTLDLWNNRTSPSRDLSSWDTTPNFILGYGGNNYRVGNSSNAMNHGAALSDVTLDFASVTRPKDSIREIGAFEMELSQILNYRMSEGTGLLTNDWSGRNITGTITNATWAPNKNGTANNALSFNGTNAYVANILGPNPSSAMTILGWFKHSSSGGGTYTGIDKNGCYRLVAIENGAASSRWEFLMYDTTTPTPVYHNVQLATAISNDVWHHIAGTYNGSTLTLYVDSVSQATSSWSSGSIRNLASEIDVGRRDLGAAYYSGSIDDVKIYNRALSAAEILSDYQN